MGDLVYVQNYGQGPKWLEGKLVEVLGSVVYNVLWEDGRQVKRHAEQLWKRQGTMQVPSSPQTQSPMANDTELLDDGVSANGEGAASGTVASSPADTMSATTQPEELPSGDTISEPQGTEMESETAHSDVRRSTRERHSPDRFGH